jgi:peptide/nickel transport system permease protein
MWPYVARRVGQAAIVVFLVATIAFVMLHVLPLDEARAVLGPTAPSWMLRNFRIANGLNKSLPVQYWYFLTNLFGHLRIASAHTVPPSLSTDYSQLAYAQGISLWSLVDPGLRNTVALAAFGYVFSIPGSFALAYYLTRSGGSRRWAGTFRVVSYILYSIPPFVLALWLSDLSSRLLGYTENPVGWATGNPFTDWPAMVIPALAIAVGDFALYSRYLRSALADGLVQDYVRTARAKGASEQRLFYRHLLRNAMTAPVSMIPNRLGAVLGMQAIVEYEFGYPGVGNVFVNGALTQDWYTTIGSVVVVGVLIVLGSLLADVALAGLDPRIRLVTV